MESGECKLYSASLMLISLYMISVFYDGKRMFSRLGNLFTPPQTFLDSKGYHHFVIEGNANGAV